jgi:hypothetical protein
LCLEISTKQSYINQEQAVGNKSEKKMALNYSDQAAHPMFTWSVDLPSIPVDQKLAAEEMLEFDGPGRPYITWLSEASLQNGKLENPDILIVDLP